MHGRILTCYRSRGGLFLGTLLSVLCFVNVGGAQTRLSAAGLLKLTGATTVVSPSMEPQQASPAYRAGREAGRADAERNLPRNDRNSRWTTRQESRDYQAGYNRGYSDALDAQSDNRPFERDDIRVEGDDERAYSRTDDRFGITIGRDNLIRWQAPGRVRVYVQVDNQPPKLFAEGPSGVQEAPWIESGHLYVFVVRDLNGNEIARDRLDLRRGRR